MEIKGDAPAVARAELEIDAPPELVWEVLTDLEAWPRWNPDVKSVAVEGPLAPGTTFKWKAGPGTITSTLREVDPARRITWTGKTLGIRAIHVWQLEPSAGRTRARSEESWEGAVVRLARGRMQKTLADSVEGGLRHLRDEVERRRGP